MTILKRASLPDQLYEELKRRIVSLELPLGSRLNASELQKELNVSSTPIREALNRLSQEGLIVYENNVGAHVMDLTERDIGEIGEVNFALHAEAMRLAMRSGKNDEIADRIEDAVQACENAVQPEKITDTVMQIMDILFAYAGNSRLKSSTCGLAAQQRLLINLCLKAQVRNHADFLQGLQEYRSVCRALRNHDLNEAVNALERIADNGRIFSVQGLAVIKG